MTSRLLIGLVRIYQLLLSPIIPPSCRFLPSCSEYACQALDRHGAIAGGWLAVRRLARCHPWGSCGYDPVPPTSDSFAPVSGAAPPCEDRGRGAG